MRPQVHSPTVGIFRYLAPALLLLVPVSGWAQQVIATVAVGTHPIAVAVNPVTNKIYVANCVRSANWARATRGTVTVIDGNSHATTEVPAGVCPTAVAVNSVTNKIYVANFGKVPLLGSCASCSDRGSVTVIDGATNAAIMIAADSNVRSPRAVTVNPVTNKIYVANNWSGNVTVIDGVDNSISRVSMPGQPIIYHPYQPQPTYTESHPYDVAVNPVTDKVYVSSFRSVSPSEDTVVSVIDGATNATTAVTDPRAVNPIAVAVNPVSNKVYVANNGNPGGTAGASFNVGSVTVVDGATNATANIADPFAMVPHAVVVNPTLDKIYIANSNGTVTAVDGLTNSFMSITDQTGSVCCDTLETRNIALEAAGNHVYVARGNITVIDGFTNSTTTLTDPSAVGPSAVAVNPVTRRVYVVNSNSNNVTVIDGGPPRTAPPAWVRRNIMAAAAKADFNADGKADLVWRHTSGAVSLWKMNGVTPAEAVSLTPTATPDWKPVGSGDLDGDGKPEIVWQNTDGRLAAWFMSGDTLQRSSYLNPVSPGSPAWKVVALADMNQDGKADLIWQHDNGSLAVWYMDGVTLIGWTFLTPASVEDTQWRIVGAGDVDGDGMPDLVWQHSEGWVGAWIMSGAQATAWLPLTPGQVDPSWKIRAVIDLNGDGQTDLVWQHRDGWVCAWLMIGAKVASMPFLVSSTVDTSWQLVGPR